MKIEQNEELIAIPIQFNPNFSAATPTVPEPKNGSKTVFLPSFPM